jgi:hypothetical protein
MWDMDSLHSKSHIHRPSLTVCAKMLGERMERDTMVGVNDKNDLKNKLNVGECMIFFNLVRK